MTVTAELKDELAAALDRAARVKRGRGGVFLFPVIEGILNGRPIKERAGISARAAGIARLRARGEMGEKP